MPDWNSPEEIAKDTVVFVKLQHAMAGIYFWEFLVSLHFEWDFVTRKRKLRWPMIFYFLGRYTALFTVITLLITLNAGTEYMNCQALYTFLAVVGQTTIGFASVNLAIRAMALWGQDKRVVVPLTVLICGHWAVLLQACVVSARMVPGTGCVADQTKPILLMLTFTWSIVLDTVVFMLCAWKIIMTGVGKRTNLVDMIFKDGLIYLFVAMAANIPAAVFVFMNFNPVMQLMFNSPAALASTIGASRAVRRLASYNEGSVNIYTSGGITPQHAPTERSLAFARPAAPQRQDTLHIQVEMDTLTAADDGAAYYGKKGSL
ncbi:hypothetical protein EIP91_006063 [Steccherinum ochraceum]|uniref:Uncharacterized protein n=1 Tax=Steccherinum ochraceum TaxID=92696 RepID=A0A4R0R692_9APHY|nr:hypothetical protein EIP91_006063 [Steccherinum ochraceum]